jgi:hypothetical protein
MARSERRITPRFNLHTALIFHRKASGFESAQEVKAINVSCLGAYFSSSLGFCVGEALEVSVELPRRVTGTEPATRRFASRVAHVEPHCLPQGQSGIGVQFLYSETVLVSPQPGNTEH